MSTAAIEVTELTRRFGHFTAVDALSFSVQPGTIFGFLGANGAGKSTAIRMLCGLLAPSAGTARVAGYDIRTGPEQVKRSIGYMSQKFSLYRDLTVRENISFYGGVYGLSAERVKQRTEWVLGMAGLTGREDSLTAELSGGWKQRLALGCAVLHEPRIIFLDEPTSGVDPVSRREFWDLINSLAAAGTTVLVTTHYLDEAEYCNDIILIQAGRLIAQGSPGELKSNYMRDPMFEVECDRLIDALALLQQLPEVGETSVFGSAVHATVTLGEDAGRTAILGALQAAGITVRRIGRITPTLEDVFIHLIEQQSAAGSK